MTHICVTRPRRIKWFSDSITPLFHILSWGNLEWLSSTRLKGHWGYQYGDWRDEVYKGTVPDKSKTFYKPLTCVPDYLGASPTVYPKKYAHGFVVLCFVVVIQSFIMNSHEVFIRIHQGCFAGTGAIVRLPQCQWSKPDGYGKISQCITTTKHSKTKTVCIFLGIYCTMHFNLVMCHWP